MRLVDARLSSEEKSLLASMIGKTLDALIHDEYLVNPSAYMSVWVIVDGEVYEVHRETAALDRFGERDDVAVTSIRKATPNDVQGHIVGRRLVTDEIGRAINDIKVIEDVQQLHKSVAVSGTHAFTAAIVFELEGTELVLEPDTWFSEDIFIDRGPGASKRLPDAIEDVPEGDREFVVVAREYVSMLEWAETESRAAQ